MARSKPTKLGLRPGMNKTQRLDIGPDSPIPSNVITYLLALPASHESSQTTEASSADSRSPKRRKTELNPDSSIYVATDKILIRRRNEDHMPPCYSESQDAGSSLKFFMSNGQLVLASRSTSPLGPLSCRISLNPQEFTNTASKIIELAGYESRQDKPGALWTDINLCLEITDDDVSITLSLRLFWNDTPSPYLPLRNNRSRIASQILLGTFFSAPSPTETNAIGSPMDFYEAAYVPPQDDPVALSITVPGLAATLFPYQKRTLKWTLAREGKQWVSSSATVQNLPTGTINMSAFRPVYDTNGGRFFVSDLLQTATRDLAAYQQAETSIRGGILAEEMGLGKTLEILSLILLHTRPKESMPDATAKIISSGATLIVTPESLRLQWMSEISRHAPGLRVKHYEGCKKLSEGDDDMASELASYDVVITTYSVLSAELHFATEPPQRSRRFARAYPRAISPLVQISWWRLCLDEAQMVENGFTQAAIVARVIPRVNAWGITGTPVKDHVKDLFGLLLFLRYEPYCSASQVWQALIKYHKPLFQQLFGAISLRHTKTLVRNELSLPPQKRYVISMPFTAVEEQHYQSLCREMAEECKLDLSGSPAIETWDPEDHEDTMSVWLNRLRQATLHPEVGVYSRRVLGYNKARPIRTVDEVLTAMLEQNEIAIRADERAYLSSRLARGQLYENSPRVREALAIWQDVRKETDKLVLDAKNKLEAAKNAVPDGGVNREDEIDSSDDASDSENESDEFGNHRHLSECQRRLRAALEMHHKAVFFCANAYFQIRDNPDMTEAGSEEFERLKKLEDDDYEEAQVIRRKVLHESYRKASRLMGRLSSKASEQTFADIPELVVNEEKGIESGRIVDNLEVLYGELNEQANVLDDWREHLVQLLLRPLVDEEDDVEITGEELNDSTKIQDELMVYVQALRAAIADRQDAITGQANELVRHETETSLRVARNGDGPAPEKLIELLAIRAQIKPKLAQISMRSAIGEFRGLNVRLTRDATESGREMIESQITSNQLKSTQAALNEQNKAALALEGEIESFKAAMNARLEYYRQLQAVSDAVLPCDESQKSDEAAAKLEKVEDDLRRKLSSAESKHRYLLNLKETGNKSNEPRLCVICQMPFMMGVLTVCGHEFCKECMAAWFKAHRNCPVCKRSLKLDNLHDITLNRKQLQIHSEHDNRVTEDGATNLAQKATTSSKSTMIYSEFNQDKLSEIMDMELEGPSFTTKVDTLVRHLLWLRESDPGAKSIVFSQYKGFLNILRNAFTRFRIGHASIDDDGGIVKFKDDPATECFLLHARAHSSGLNLVNASHVFLCEPLLNTALELQAIARVDRIGQQHETTVWLYLVSGTVEESIYNLSVRRRMEHMGRNLKSKSRASTPGLVDANIEAANTLELEQASLSKLMSRDKTAGEVVQKGDLWECLFGHVSRQPDDDTRFQDRQVVSYMAGEAAIARKEQE